MYRLRLICPGENCRLMKIVYSNSRVWSRILRVDDNNNCLRDSSNGDDTVIPRRHIAKCELINIFHLFLCIQYRFSCPWKCRVQNLALKIFFLSQMRNFKRFFFFFQKTENELIYFFSFTFAIDLFVFEGPRTHLKWQERSQRQKGLRSPSQRLLCLRRRTFRCLRN